MSIVKVLREFTEPLTESMYKYNMVIKWENGDLEGFTGTALDSKAAKRTAEAKAARKAALIKKEYKELSAKDFAILSPKEKKDMEKDWKLSAIMDESKEVVEAKEKEEIQELTKEDISKYEKEIANIFANALAVALAQSENLMGEQFQSVKDAQDFVTSAFYLLKGKEKNQLTSALRRFERMGGAKTKSIFKRVLAHESISPIVESDYIEIEPEGEVTVLKLGNKVRKIYTKTFEQLKKYASAEGKSFEELLAIVFNAVKN